MILRQTYLRITRWEVPPGTIAGNLRRLALASRPVFMVEGVLLKDLQVGEPILFRACWLGRPYRRIYLSSPVVILEGEFVLTHRALFQFLRVPPITSFPSDPSARVSEESVSKSVHPSVTRQTRSSYCRATVYSVPMRISVPDLSALALMGYPCAVLEGYLRPRPRRGGRLKFHADQTQGRENRVIHESAPIQCREGNYFLTALCLYHVQRLPDPRGDKA
jgi:hypothetical protein